MNRKLLTIIVVCVGLALTTWLFITRRQADVPPKLLTQKEEPTDSPAKPAANTAPPKGKYDQAFEEITLTEEEQAAKPPDVTDANWLATVFFHRMNVREKNGDVEFYGKVIDQDGAPVEGAKVEAYASSFVESLREQVAHGGGKTEKRDFALLSDSKGLFSITGHRARSLTFRSIEKDGYTSSKKMPGGFMFSPTYSSQHTTSSTEPVIFPMWRKGISEPLSKKFCRKRVVPDGRVYTFDLRASRVIEGDGEGDLRIRVVADYQAADGTTRYPWTLEIEAIEGGLISSADPYPYRAPETGYQPELSWDSTDRNGKWSRDLLQTLYVEGRNKEFYASIRLDMKVFFANSASIEMNILVNPSGSRNLEYDPAKEIKS